jgi:acetyl esterase/lipase
VPKIPISSYACAAVALGLPALLSAQDTTAPSPVETVRNIEYARPNGFSLKLDLYIPGGVLKPMPVVMWVHGGGWCEGNKNIPMMLPLVQLGFAVASIDYRLSQQAIFPAQIYDCKAAVRWLRANASRYGFDPNRIGAAGASAGGHLVALLGTTADRPEMEGEEGNPGVSSAVQAVCDFFGPTDFTDLGPSYSASPTTLIARLLGGSIDDKMEEAKAASPVLFVDAHSAPFYIAHGDQDRVVPLQQSVELDAALRKAGVPSTLYIVKGGGHGFNDPAAFAGAALFFRRYLQIPP